VLGILVDNLLRPVIVSRRLTLHPLLIFLGILGGVSMLGIAGLVIGPMIFAFATACLRIYLRDFVAPEKAAR
jgi:predicted PurR-regulated permease PerM